MLKILLMDFNDMSILEIFFKSIILEFFFLLFLFKPHLNRLQLQLQYNMIEIFFDSIKYLILVFIFFIIFPVGVIVIISNIINFFSSKFYWEFYYFFKENAKLYFNFSTIVITAILLNFRDRVLMKIENEERIPKKYNSILVDKTLDEKLENHCIGKGLIKSQVIEEIIIKKILEFSDEDIKFYKEIGLSDKVATNLASNYILTDDERYKLLEYVEHSKESNGSLKESEVVSYIKHLTAQKVLEN